MNDYSKRHRITYFALLLGIGLGLPSPMFGEPLQSPPIPQAESLFNQHCARCHGFGASGGEGPSLKRAQFRSSADDETLASIIRDGIPGTDMPGTWQLSDSEIQAVIAYVNKARSSTPSERPTGDVDNGRTIYESKGCSVCHMVDGDGGSVGPDLSLLGDRRGLQHIRESVVNASSYISPRYLLVEATTLNSETIQGIRANEDAFTIQLRDASGQFHSFDKASIATLDKQFDKSLMPNFGSELTSDELEDLIAYLVNSRSAR